MLDINFIRQNPEKVKEGIAKKNADPKLVDKFLRWDEEWRAKISVWEGLKVEQKTLSKELMKSQASDLLSRAQILKKRLADLEKEKKELEQKREESLSKLPNLPLDDVPVGPDETANKILRELGQKRKFNFPAKEYLEIAEKLDLIDTKRAAKVSGSRFGYLKNEIALLEFSLVKLAFDFLIPENFIPIIPPVLIKEKMMKGMGYIDKTEDKEETYFLEKDNLYLIATSEQSVGPLHADEVLKEEELPKRYVAFSSCFRREAGSYGKDTTGILRVHQFDKVEMFSFCHPDKSKEEHQFLLLMAEKLMQALQLPYRVVQMCTGDLGGPAAAKYDIEAWLPGQNNGQGEYRETHSLSNCTDFQARRLNIRFRDKKGKLGFVHTLNGTAFSQRPLIAIIENYQTKQGTVKVPDVLKPFIDKNEIKIK
ncbi:serine--tRNA ligase [Candidatus Jorgensenbacteria bacterium CG_4_10_14_0_8_um_filter_39_13]|uniref:Serine--tRNA ligase n=2 Tax=Candidatus Joergenseniibacteriota TaxID=1752739 RepID=A0A2M7RGR2_9BACT|nr:MAG: serine--tRNA ligase [Candidatus Jorgensenbacteria bacterium CG11_big_fil_rev_8_21_14_0_20_38_23]PIV13177.1 MAG: serine--tRNA ligase [Candidatus Jorgensenbacteria bacterium CG03_land_8_20_14_0_80_38_39]PIW97723.1 MAG: serine--tRNA ligase [Candidatus Jorgensenbacteria bacterium CG_4_8_14_3_um_filter_38_10]PIY95762.1 MAG: serine--tRNA ligase [Candidatus Jorgensenbacteria bacterium CG_4_10_14_0_8_um_filter_39_13]PJA95237.1 MAG: serine--tRNA ligase [Candidatus Jorgensenbacteria bacterium CG_